MEEDIKVLEEHIEFLKRNDVEDMYGDFIGELKAIENLIKEYRDLQYKLKEKICFEGHQQFKELQKNSIPKSKVKEIIENHYPDVACQKLTELLEGELKDEKKLKI